MSSGLFKVNVKFLDSDGNPLTGDEYTVRLFDEDRYFDDKLGKSKLDNAGNAEFLITVADIMSIDSLDERTPDLYFIVEQDGKEIYRSETIPKVNFEVVDPVTGRSKSLTMDFGPFTVKKEV
jgi:hypothetical protein